ncbi:hypothetical protein GIB67_009038 [Kingdonia uniflora]|uniref:Uncharacterized protein n=1 Tax=Kingdonia uniflora TaxID=39325 RepID=A0A7J7LW14_9MAGN|nr:hypothetical protein GIB67_009038 [Kingdonia uniflora]
MLENSNVKKYGFRTSAGVEIDIDVLKINHHDVPTEKEVPRAADFVGGVGEDALEIKAGVVTEESKKFDRDGLEMKHYEETTDIEVHRAINLVGGKDVDVLESSRSKSHEEVYPCLIPDLKSGSTLMVSGRCEGNILDFVKIRGILADMSNIVVNLKVQKAKAIPLEKGSQVQGGGSPDITQFYPGSCAIQYFWIHSESSAP